jgi:hypothetical protein
MHAHKCKACAQKGVTTIWVHGDENYGDQGAHSCPVCRSKEWESHRLPNWSLPTGAQPKPAPAPAAPNGVRVYAMSENLLLGYSLLAGMMGVLAYVAIRKWGSILEIPA